MPMAGVTREGEGATIYTYIYIIRYETVTDAHMRAYVYVYTHIYIYTSSYKAVQGAAVKLRHKRLSART